MAKRPVFIPSVVNGSPTVKVVEVAFTWYPGLAVSQAQKSINSLHQAAGQIGLSPLLEISSKSPTSLGVALSAFNLMLTIADGQKMSVECAFQGSKVFQQGGPYQDLFTKTSREAKQDERLRSSGSLIAFEFLGVQYPTQPLTVFYDWLYLQALSQNTDLSSRLEQYNGFTDIAFNPEKSLNCQARSAALFVAFNRAGRNDKTN